MKKNILLISQSMSIGGAEKVLSNLSLELEDNYNVYIISYSKDDKEYEYGGKRINIDCPGGNVSYIQKIRNLLYRCKIVKKLKKEWKIDVSISFVPQTDVVNILTRTNKEKIVIEVSSNTSVAFQSRCARLLRKMILKRADSVVAVSKGSKHDLEMNFGIPQDKLSVIYNSCDTETIQKNCIGCSGRKSNVIAAGSFRKPKGHWHLIKAFSLIAPKFPNTKLVILGEGAYRKKYIELINELGLNEMQVEMPGFYVNPYIHIANAKIFVFSSIYEGFGNVIIESMACGTPVISTDCNFGPREIISPDSDALYRTKEIEYGEYGCIVPHMGDLDIDVSSTITSEECLLAEAMERLLLDDELRNYYSNKGFERCKDFDIKAFGEEWKKLLWSLM